jgi:hypothetical protein
MMKKEHELCFVYNAQSGVGHALMDYVHKIVSPDTYACSLCSVTYGNLGMHREWGRYLKALPFKTRFLYQDTMPDMLKDVALPAAFVVTDEQWEQVMDDSQMNEAKSLDELIALCDATLAAYIDA